MTDTRFVCLVCRSVFPERRAVTDPVEPEEAQLRCPECGSTRVEPDHFDPDEPVENPLERNEPEESGP